MKNICLNLCLIASIIHTVSCSRGSKIIYESASIDSLRNSVEYLASDQCEGRLPFTQGADRACDYLEAKMTEYGLITCWQNVPLVKIESLASATMKIEGAAQMELRYLEDFTAFNKCKGDTEIDAELVFAGYGIVAPEYGKNDFAGIENPGNKVAVVIVNDPGLGSEGEYFNGDAMTYYGRWTYKFEEGARQGLKGVLIIHNDRGAGYPWSTVNSGAGMKYALDDESQEKKLPLEGWLTGDAARKLLEESGYDADSLYSAAKSASFKPVALNSRVKVSISNKSTSNQSPNIIGYIPGTSDECIVCIAHWDHLGMKSPDADGDGICNGATDNATALAWLLETARILKKSGHQFRRNIVFLAPTTEELGMWGSEYYVANPIFPMEKTVAVINKDVLTLWGECNDVTITGFGYSDLDEKLAEVATGHGCYIMADPEASNGMFYRSDHLPFMRKGVPALFAKGWSDSREHGREWSAEKIKDYWKNIYHSVNDETGPEDDYSGLKQEVDIFCELISDLADSSWWPTWSKKSEFQR